MSIKINIYLLVICYLTFPKVSMAQPSFSHFQNSNTRAISMGGAFTSVQDFDNSLLWNPASLILAKDRTKLKDENFIKINADLLSLSSAIIAVGAGLIINAITSCDTDEFGECTENNGAKISAYGLGILLYGFRGVTFIDNDNFLVSLNLHEDIFDNETTIKNVFDNSYQSLFFSYKFGRELSVGAGINYYQVFSESQRKNGIGFNVGLQYNSLKVKGLYYGISYFKFADNIKYVRSKVERIFDNSLNFGISYDYKDQLLISLDIKNITSFSKSYFGELHVGFEEKIYEDLYFRQGFYFIDNNKDKFVKSFGIGIKTSLFDLLNFYEFHFWDFSLGIIINDNKPNNRRDVSFTCQVGW